MTKYADDDESDVNTCRNLLGINQQQAVDENTKKESAPEADLVQILGLNKDVN